MEQYGFVLLLERINVHAIYIGNVDRWYQQ